MLKKQGGEKLLGKLWTRVASPYKIFSKGLLPNPKVLREFILCRLPEGGCKEIPTKGGKEDRRSQTRLEQIYKTKKKLYLVKLQILRQK